MGTLRSLLVILTLAFSSLSILAQRATVMPRPLKKGDRIAVISPSSVPTEKTVREGCDILRQWGYEPVVGPNAL